MSRRRAAIKREVLPDPFYSSLLITRFVNRVMKRGKKSIAEKIVYGALEKLKPAGPDVLETLNECLANVRPIVEVRSRRLGGATYQVPVEVPPARQEALAMRWLIDGARKRSSGKTMSERLAYELQDARDKKGAAVKKREDVHKMAEANKAFAHYRW